MVTGKEDLLQSLIEAFAMEKGTKIFYSEAADKMANAGVRKTFQELAKMEKKHMDFIQYLYQSINGDLELTGFEEFKNSIDAPVTEAGIPVKDLEEKLEKHIYDDEKGALTLALKIEGRASNIYYDLSRNASDANARIVFKVMVEQEAGHIEYLKKARAEMAESDE